MNLFRRCVSGGPRHTQEDTEAHRSLTQKCLARRSVHVPAKTRVHTCTQSRPPRMHKCTLHACTDDLSARHSSRWARDLREGAQYRAARAAATPFLGCSQPSAPRSALRAPAAAAAVRGHPSRAALCSARFRASVPAGARERAGEGTAAGAEGWRSRLSALCSRQLGPLLRRRRRPAARRCQPTGWLRALRRGRPVA